MKRNFLVKGEQSLLGRKISFYQDTKILVYSSTTFEDVRNGAVLRAKKRGQEMQGCL